MRTTARTKTASELRGRLLASGISISQVARRSNVPRSTVDMGLRDNRALPEAAVKAARELLEERAKLAMLAAGDRDG